jgi:hypothetical protein
MSAKILFIFGLQVLSAALGAGCAIEKQPGRCAACIYDGCIIPIGDSTKHEIVRPEAPSPMRPRAATGVRY